MYAGDQHGRLGCHRLSGYRSTPQDAAPILGSCRHRPLWRHPPLEIARSSKDRLATVNLRRRETGEEQLTFGLALHLGDVLFGNIGLPERVSFSVIGSTVNEVARLEALTKELGRQVLATGAFAGHTSIMWDNLGRHQLRGVGACLEVLSPAEG